MTSLSLDRLEEILGRAQEVRIAVVGDLMLDVYLTGAVSRISPEAPVPVVQVQDERIALGGAANVGANIAELGASCDVIGCVGADGAGDEIRQVLAGLGPGEVIARLVETADRPTTTKTRVMARSQQVVRFDREQDQDLSAELAAKIGEAVAESVREADVLVLEDYNKGVLTPPVIRSAMRVAAQRGIPVVVDPKFRHIFEYRGATVFKPNSLELSAAMGVPLQADDDQWLEMARQRFACENLLVTLGEAGMALRSSRGHSFRIPAVAREVFDVSGAGDTVTACIAIALAAGADMRESALLANLAAAIEVGKPGVATVTPDELRSALAALQHPSLT
ncbi:D-glycero-beta-D-manno-heptose-7-phosphate kinase [soil metagenome]